MTYNFIYEPVYYPQTIRAVMIDARQGTPLANRIGVVIDQFVQQQVDLVTDNTIFYKIETEQGVLAGYFWITVDNIGNFNGNIPPNLRPAYSKNFNDISNLISNFILANEFSPDFLI